MRTTLAVLLLLASSAPALAGGVIGDLIEGACGNCGAGRALDNAHREVKKAVPPYGAAEEGISGGVRNLSREAAVETAGPALFAMIVASRDDALRGGVSPIPPHIHQDLAGFFGDDFLNGVRYRVGQGGELTLQANSFRFGDRAGITLDHVIVFRHGGDVNDPWLWAHELGHVVQVERSGLMDFAKRYVRDYQAMEDEASRIADDFMAQRTQMMSSVQPPMSTMPLSNQCVAPLGWCSVPPAPVGTSCYCVTFNGQQHLGMRQ